MPQSAAVFLDLNGTLVTPIVVDRLDELRPIEGITEQVARLCQAGLRCPVVTIQSRIEKGFFSEAAFRAWFADFAGKMAADGASLLGPYVCPHRFSTPCACKKPQTLLYERAAVDYDLVLSQSYVVGDSAADVEAARRFGGWGCLLQAPDGAEATQQQLLNASYLPRSMKETVDWILSRGCRTRQ